MLCPLPRVTRTVPQHRKLVSVFMKILGLGLKPCEVSDKDKAHLAVHAVQENVERSDGTITRLICDDKGAPHAAPPCDACAMQV